MRTLYIYTSEEEGKEKVKPRDKRDLILPPSEEMVVCLEK